MCVTLKLKVTKRAGLYPVSRKCSFAKTAGGGQTDPHAFFTVKGNQTILNMRIYCAKEVLISRPEYIFF